MAKTRTSLVSLPIGQLSQPGGRGYMNRSFDMAHKRDIPQMRLLTMWLLVRARCGQAHLNTAPFQVLSNQQSDKACIGR